MGRSRYHVGDNNAPHFVTCTVLNWMPLFTRPQTVEIILEALQYRQEQAGWKIYGFLILENHLHLVVQCENLSEEFPRFKSFTARKLIDYPRKINWTWNLWKIWTKKTNNHLQIKLPLLLTPKPQGCGECK